LTRVYMISTVVTNKIKAVVFKEFITLR
jgi:hypothetical protein